MASGLIESAMKRDLQTRSLIKVFASDGEKMVFTTDADGKFTLPLKGKAWFHAMAERKVGDSSEGYIWLKAFEPADGASKASLVISNDDDINDEDELYLMLAGACEVQGRLENFRNVEVSEKMKSLVGRHREDVAQAKAKAEETYKKFPGSGAGEERVWQIAPGVTMTFCWCPAGQFMMGSPSSEADRGSNEERVKVTLSNGFWMGKAEVTQAQWLAVMGNNPSHIKGANFPVESVSWNDAQEFIQKIDPVLAATDGWKTMLPTEAQWEYAARAGESCIYSGSDNLDKVGWYNVNSGSTSKPVGTKKPNTWGLHDMSGNVYEWCRDWYAEKLLGGVDPAGASSGSVRVGRGGNCRYYASGCRVASRNGFWPTGSDNYNYFGFRVVRSSAP